jgi:uncharacterized membrane protein YphA (DoxX/SURF4 family)
MKRSLILEIIVALFILLFVYTGTSKFLDFPNFSYVLSRSPLIGSMAPVVAWALPLTEFAIALLLFFPRTRKLGLWASFLIMLMFTGYLTYMIYFTPDRPCNCGGVLKQMTWKQHLVFNIFFTLLALAGIWLSRRRQTTATKNEQLEQPVFT